MSLAYSDEALVGNLVQELGSGSVSTDPGVLAANSHDFGKLVGIMLPIAVVYA
jgi:glycolate oxidase